jgi:diaminopimelate decarboxylase
MTESSYVRPSIIRNPVGSMNKVGRREDRRSRGEIDGIPVARLCEQFGSPLFTFSERRIRARVREARRAFVAHYPNTRLAWSYKTNYLAAVCAIFHQEGSLAEVVSGMEYEKARRLQIPGRDILFNGPAKTHEELTRAVREGAVLHADHMEEIHLLERIAQEQGCIPEVGIRVGLDAGILPRWDRFGFELEGGQALEAALRIAKGGRLRFGGLHCHIGTFVLDPTAYGRAASKLLDFGRTLEQTLGVRPRHFDLGGGFASNNTLAGQYHSGALAPPIAEYAAELTRPFVEYEKAFGYAPPLLIEAGRALIDDAGTLVTSVIANKRLSNGKRAIVVDAGVNLLFTAWWYRLNVSPVQQLDDFLEDTVVYGPLCMNIDCIRESVPLPNLSVGDQLTISPVGAYTVTQSMQFIKLRPACVLLAEDGAVELIRRAEELDDLTRAEVFPERLSGPYLAAPSAGPA